MQYTTNILTNLVLFLNNEYKLNQEEIVLFYSKKAGLISCNYAFKIKSKYLTDEEITTDYLIKKKLLDEIVKLYKYNYHNNQVVDAIICHYICNTRQVKIDQVKHLTIDHNKYFTSLLI